MSPPNLDLVTRHLDLVTVDVVALAEVGSRDDRNRSRINIIAVVLEKGKNEHRAEQIEWHD